MIVPTIFFNLNSYLFVYEESADRHLGIIRPDAAKMRMIRRLTKETIGNMQLHHIRRDDIERTLEMARRGGCSLAQVEQLRRWLRQVFDQAIIDGLIRVNPCEGIECRRISQRTPVHFHESEYRRAVDAIKRMPYSTFYRVMMMTGLRAELIAALTPDCLDFEAGRIRVSQKLIYEGAKTTFQYFDAEDDYSVVMPEELRACLLREKRIQERCRLLNGNTWNNPERLFLTNTDGSPINMIKLRRQYQLLRKESGIRDFSMRTLRSSYLVTAFREGGDMAEAIRQTGFLNIGSVMRYYYEAERELDRRRARRIMLSGSCE